MSNQSSLFSDFLKALEVPHTLDASNSAFNSMSFQSLFGFSRLLDSYKIPNMGYRFADKSVIDKIPTPFIAQLSTHLVIVVGKKANPDSSIDLDYLLFGKEYSVSESDFISEWTGIALLAYPDSQSAEPGYTKNHLLEIAGKAKYWILIICSLFLFGYGFYENRLWASWSTIALTVLDLCGIYITFQLLLKSLKVNVKTADRICGVLQKHGCDTVLEQKASKFFGLFSWAEVGVAYFTVSLIVMVIFPETLNYLALINGCCLPFTVWSISYQKFKLHTWCTLCVITQCLLWLLFFCYLFGGWWTNIFPLRLPLFVIVAAYGAVLFGLNRVSNFINRRTAN